MSLTPTKVLGVIPARFNSQRFFGKLLQGLDGEPILHRAIKRALQVKSIDKLIVVSGDEVILNSIESLSVSSMNTGDDFNCGSDRCASVLPHYLDYDIIINIQGDQPMLDPDIVEVLIKKMKSDQTIQIASLMSTASCESTDPSVVKVKVNDDGIALSFTRSLVEGGMSYEHIGVYGFRRNTLLEISQLEPSQREMELHLEQLRWTDHGYDIHMFHVPYIGLSINTAADLIRYNLNPSLLHQL